MFTTDCQDYRTESNHSCPQHSVCPKAAFPFQRFYIRRTLTYHFCPCYKFGSNYFSVGVSFCADFCMFMYPCRNPHKKNANIKHSLIRICNMDKNHTDKARRIKRTHKRNRQRLTYVHKMKLVIAQFQADLLRYLHDL